MITSYASQQPAFRGGGSAPTPEPGEINAPTVAQTSDGGDVPFEWGTTVDDSVYAGDIWRVETSASSSTNVDGSFVTPTQSLTKQISPSEFTPGYVGDFTVTAFPPPSAPFETPSGTFYFHIRVERYTEEGTIASPWSNTLSETIVSATTIWTSTNGTSKSQYVAVSGTPGLITTGTDGLNSFCGIRANTAASGKRQFEITLNTLPSHLFMGIDDGTMAYGPGYLPTIPGNANNSGVTYRTDGYIYHNSDVPSVATCIAGDVVTIEFDTDANTLSFYRTRSGTTTQIGTTRTGVNFTTTYAFVGTNNAEVATANFGQNAFARALDTGYSMYG